MSSASPVLTAPETTELGSPVLREYSGDIAVLILNRPRARNTLAEATLQALQRALADIAEEKAVRAVVLAARGSVFSAGHDLKELSAHRSEADGGRGYTQHIMQICSAMMLSILRLPRVVNWLRPAIWLSPHQQPSSALPASTSACSVRRRWSLFPAMWAVSMQ